MVASEELELEGAYKEQGFAVPVFIEEGGLHLQFNVKVEGTYVKGYTVDLTL